MIMSVRRSKVEDARGFTFRQMDAEECMRGGGLPSEVLERSIQASTSSHIVFFDDVPAVVWGYKSYDLCPSVANVWMLTGPAVDDHKWEFVREIRRTLKVLDTHFISYHSIVLRDYVAARRLLAMVGFREVETDDPEFILMEKKGRPLWVN
jgi:hypothetical protein